MFIQNEQGEILNNPVLQEAVLDAARRTVPDLALKLSLPPSSSEERDGQRLGFADIWLDGRSERFHTLQRNHSQLHDMGVLLSRLKDSHGNYPPLLIIPHMPLKQALQCKEAHLNFLDAAGNMFLRIGSSILFVAGMPRPKIHETDGSFKALATSAGMRILFNLLISPELINTPYREISLRAQVSLGSVSHTLESLASHKFIEGHEKNRRRLIQKTALMDLWASNYPLTLRRKLQAHRFSTTHSSFRILLEWGRGGLSDDPLHGTADIYHLQQIPNGCNKKISAACRSARICRNS